MKQKIQGQSMIEYIVIVSVVSIAAIPALTKYGTALSKKTQEVASTIAGSTDLSGALGEHGDNDNYDQTGPEPTPTDPAPVDPPDPGPEPDPQPDPSNSDLDSYANSLLKEAIERVAEAGLDEPFRIAREVFEASGASDEFMRNLEDRFKDLQKPGKDLLDNISTGANALITGSSFILAEQEIDEQIANGNYQGAYTTMVEQSLVAPMETFLSSKYVKEALEKLPSPVASAISVELPQTTRRVAREIADNTWESVGSYFNNLAWSAYENGYVNRKPRLDKDHFD